MNTQISPEASSRKPSNSKPKIGLFKIGVAGLFIALVVAAFTNPSQAEYINYASTRFVEKLKEDCNEFGSSSQLGILSFSNRDICKAGVGVVSLARGGIKVMINSSTQRRNLGVLSIYKTEIGGREFKAVGIYNHFFTIQSE